jgi:SAM-dependent methyltransferase
LIAAHWFERQAFYAEAHRILVPGGIFVIVEYIRDQEGSPIAAALIEFMGRYGSERAYTPPDYRRELAEVADLVLSRRLFCPARCASISTPLSVSHSHPRVPLELSSGSGIDRARSAVRELAMPYRVDDEHVLFGYLFQCFTARREV